MVNSYEKKDHINFLYIDFGKKEIVAQYEKRVVLDTGETLKLEGSGYREVVGEPDFSALYLTDLSTINTGTLGDLLVYLTEYKAHLSRGFEITPELEQTFSGLGETLFGENVTP